MQTHPFLSPSWIESAKTLRAQYPTPNTKISPLKINLTITDSPFDEKTIYAYLDTTSGQPELELGQLNKTDLNLTIDYATAKQIFAEGKLTYAMEAMRLGRIKVDGSMFKLMSLASLKEATPDELARQIRDMTEA